MTAQSVITSSSGGGHRAPDPILAELWEAKRQINEEAGYRIEELARMAHEASERVRQGGAKCGAVQKQGTGDSSALSEH
jgi:hypothetical protein